MKHVIARYKVKPEKLEHLSRVITNFVNAVKHNEPRTLLYEAFQEKDSTWFTHLMAFDDEEAQCQHENTAYAKNFIEILYPNCEEVPVYTELTLVRSTRR